MKKKRRLWRRSGRKDFNFQRVKEAKTDVGGKKKEEQMRKNLWQNVKKMFLFLLFEF